MYVGYYICFIGVALMAQSFILLKAVLVFQVSAHWIILSEERCCAENFGEAYEEHRRR